MNPALDSQYWSQRYLEQDTGWDTGSVTPPLKAYIDQLPDPSLRILIPGAGNAYEAEYLFNKGFSRVTVCDLAAEPLANLKQRCPEFPAEQLLQTDFFGLRERFDLILEQTFFCALNPSLRPDYAGKMYELLNPGGKLAGLLFDDPLNADRPPFGGSREEYLKYFSPYFKIRTFGPCYNSIPPRKGRELFIILEKPVSGESRITAGK